jgi:His-Xaa-Ser system protein HxsD
MIDTVKNTTSLCLFVDTTIYSIEAVKKVCYRLADRVSIEIGREDSSKLKLSFHFSGREDESSKEAGVADFWSELLDQDLRETIKRETAQLRNLLLAHAFSQTSLVDKP